MLKNLSEANDVALKIGYLLIVKASAGTKAGSIVLIETLKGEAVSIAELTVDSDALPEIDSGEIAIPKSVLMSPGTYPQTWTKSN